MSNDDSTVKNLISEISKSYPPILRAAVEAQADLLGLNSAQLLYSGNEGPRTTNSTGVAEVFTDGEAIFWLRSIHSDYRRPSTPADSPVATFIEFLSPRNSRIVSKIIEICESSFKELIEISPTSKGFAGLLEEGRSAPTEPTSDNMRAVEVLTDRGARQMAIAIKSAGGLLVSDLQKQLPKQDQGRADEIRGHLENESLVTKEIVVICQRTHNQITRIGEISILDDLRGLDVRCPCGQLMADEDTEEALNIAPLCRRLLDGSYWFTLLVVSELVRVGVSVEKILVEEQVGGDELDIVADINGSLLLFELKDRDFTLRDAYSFGAKTNLIQPDLAVIITSAKVGGDVREHFRRTQTAGQKRGDPFSSEYNATDTIRYIEGLSSLRGSIENVVTELAVVRAKASLRMALPSAGVGATALLDQWTVRDIAEGSIVAPPTRRKSRTASTSTS